MTRYTNTFHTKESFIKAAKFKEKQRKYNNAREIYEKGLAELGKEALNSVYLMAFIKLEIKCKKFDRAKMLFKYSIENLP